MDAYKNLAYGVVDVSPVPPATGNTLTLQTRYANAFPLPPFNATVWPIRSQPDVLNAEIVRVTAIAAGVMTITRAQEGTTARPIAVGDQIAAGITKMLLDDVAAGAEHHGSHEPGGWDAITALSASILTSGILPDTRLSPNVAMRGQANDFSSLVLSAGMTVGTNLIIGTNLAVGTNPAQSGAIRLPNNQPITARISNNTSDVNLLSLSALNLIVVGASGNRVSVPSTLEVGTSPSASGSIRLPNASEIKARNGANTADVSMMNVTLSNVLSLGQTGTPVQIESTLVMIERTAPAAPAANRMNQWIEDDGTGKTRLMVQFATGAAIQVAIQA